MSERKVGPDGREFSLWQLVADLYDECGQEFWPDDPDAEAVCADCRAEAEAEEREFTTADEP